MHKVKQYFFFLILKRVILTFPPYADCDVVAALRHLPLYDVIFFPRRSCNNVKKKILIYRVKVAVHKSRISSKNTEQVVLIIDFVDIVTVHNLNWGSLVIVWPYSICSIFCIPNFIIHTECFGPNICITAYLLLTIFNKYHAYGFRG